MVKILEICLLHLIFQSNIKNINNNCLIIYLIVIQMIRKISAYFLSQSKIMASAQDAIKGIKSGDTLLFGGFGVCGIPMNIINAISKTDVKKLTIVSNEGGIADNKGGNAWGLQYLLRKGQVKRIISSYLGFNKHQQSMYFAGQLELELCPQGTLAEKIRSGGAGLGGFYTKTGVDTLIQKGGIPIKFVPHTGMPQIISKQKPSRIIKGVKYLYQQTIFADFAFIKAKKSDQYGNLVFNKTARNFNQDMAKAAKCVVAEVQQIVPKGSINPDQIHIPGLYVNRIFSPSKGSSFNFKKIQRLVYKNTNKQQLDPKNHIKKKIMKRAAKQIFNGAYVNLGIGIPTLLPECLPPGINVNIHAQNGIIGVGSHPQQGLQDPDLINAGKQTITTLPGASFFSASESFGIVRGGHLDITMLGALQVSRTCDIANWIVPGKTAKGMGGAMDLANSGSKVIVVMQHTTQFGLKQNRFKLVQNCTLPITAKGKVSKVITEKAVFQNRQGRLVLTEIAQGLIFQDVQKDTGFEIEKNDNIIFF